MGRWWVVVAGVAGIVGAVILIPKPQSAGMNLPAPAELPVAGAARSGEEGMRLDDEGGDGSDTKVPPSVPALTGEGAPAVGHTMRPQIVDGVQYLNPAAAELARKRNTPEAQAAARISAPWTQIRRLLKANPEDVTASALADEADQLVGDLRDMRRNSPDWDFKQVEARMSDLSSRIRQGGYGDAEMEKMLTLVDTRLTEYHNAPPATNP